MISYAVLKDLHVLTIVLSGALFLFRVQLRLRQQPIARALRVVPHVNDTVLLLAAIGMLAVGGINPIEHPWLIAKIAALLLYVALGVWALRADTPRQAAVRALLAATAFAYIVGVALTKTPFPFA